MSGEEKLGETRGEPVAVAALRPAPQTHEELVQLRAGQRPDRLGGLLLAEAERSVGSEGAGEGAEVLQSIGVERREKLGKLWVGP